MILAQGSPDGVTTDVITKEKETIDIVLFTTIKGEQGSFDEDKNQMPSLIKCQLRITSWQKED